VSDHTCDRKGPPAKVIDESGDEPQAGTGLAQWGDGIFAASKE
jgi:hypothetical protein